ncbi:conserved hypothetical protein, partial [Ricinus communis]
RCRTGRRPTGSRWRSCWPPAGRRRPPRGPKSSHTAPPASPARRCRPLPPAGSGWRRCGRPPAAVAPRSPRRSGRR